MAFSQYAIPRLTSDEYMALRSAILMGAFAERQQALQTLVASNKGHQAADVWERELKDLEGAAKKVCDAAFISN